MISTPYNTNAYFDQFNTINILYIKGGETIISISNATLALLMLFIILIVWNKNNNIIPTRLSLLSNIPHTLIQNLTNEHLNLNHNTYMPQILSIFITLILINTLGLLPYVFTTTSHIIITFSLSLTIITSSTINSLINHNSNFLSILTPQNTPMPLVPFLVLIETASYITRAISLGVRLAANISAGHLLLTILSSFTFNILLSNYYILSFFPLTILSFIGLLEITIAFIQAYVFTLLSTIYYSDTINLH